MSDETTVLRLDGVQHAYHRTVALRGVSLAVRAGEILAVTGPSGCGKSTLLHVAAGLVRPQSGSVQLFGTDLAPVGDDERARLRRSRLSLVLQFGQLVPELTGVQNVMVPLLLERHDRRAARTSALGWLERLGADHVADALPGEMSGGEAQRVAMARALVTGPGVVLADEPTGALDTVSGEQVMSVLLETARATGAAVVLVTHDNRVAAYADRDVVMHDGAVLAAEVSS